MPRCLIESHPVDLESGDDLYLAVASDFGRPGKVGVEEV